MKGHRGTRVEDGSLVDPGEVMVMTVDAVMAWAEQRMVALLAERTEPSRVHVRGCTAVLQLLSLMTL